LLYNEAATEKISFSLFFDIFYIIIFYLYF